MRARPPLLSVIMAEAEECRAPEVVDLDAVDLTTTTLTSKRTASSGGLANISENDVLTIVSEIEK